MPLKIHRTATVLALGLSLTAAAVASPFEMAASPAQIVSSSDAAIVLKFSSGSLESKQVSKDGSLYEVHQIPEEGTTFEYGRPLLPAVSRMVVVPPTAGIDFEITSDEPGIFDQIQAPALCDDSLLRDDSIEPLQSVYPGKLADVSEPFVIRGVRLVKITVFPIQYDPVARQYLNYTNIQATLRYTNDRPVNPVEVPIRRYRSETFKKVIRNLAINGDVVGRDDPPDSEPPYIGHYLVVAHEATIPWIRTWIEFRRKTGYKMDIYRVPSNEASNPSTVKSGIQNRYNAYLQAGVDPFDMIVIVGDHQYDQPAGNNAQNLLVAEPGNSIWGGGYPHADFKFACLEGGNNDQHPDVGYSRLPAGSENAAGLIMARTMSYEATPRMENPEWFTRGAAYSQHWGNSPESAWHISIHTNVRWGEEVLKSLGFNDVFFYEWYEHDQSGSRIGPEIARVYNNGANVLVGRAEIYYWQSQFQGVNRNTVFPIDIVYSGHGEWALQVVYRSGGPNDLKGPVARTGCWGWPATAPLSYIWLSMVNGVLQQDLPLGWARMLSVNKIENIFPDFQIPNVGGQLYSHIKTDTDCFGDPGIQPWIGVPRLAMPTCPDRIAPETKSLEVFVHRPNSDDAVPGARVTFYAPGRVPAQPAEYAAYSGYMMKTTIADSLGIARFVLEGDEALVNQTPLCITVSGRDIRPFTDTIAIAAPPSALTVTEWILTEREGDGDDVINPNETWELLLTAKNVGSRDAIENIEAHLSSLSPYLEVVDNEQVNFNNLNAGAEDEADATSLIRFSPATPDGRSRPLTRPELKVTLRSGEQSWESIFKFDPAAPNLEIARIIGNGVIPDSMVNFNVEIKNTGSIPSPDMMVDLRSLGMGVTVVENRSSIGSIAPGRTDRLQSPFVIGGNRIVVPGSKNDLLLIFSSEAGFVDSTKCQVQIQTERQHAPTGPDKYGYICFDDTDQEWDMAPTYDWLEINPNIDHDYEGTRLDSIGNSQFDIGRCQVIPLGFTTRFYGHDYDRVTIAQNGFVSMGRQPRITNFQNWPMDQAIGGGVGMIAPFWDDLRFGQNSGIFYYHDEEEARFIIEWYRMRPATGDADLTFQLILFDSDTWITETGNQNILIQYQSINNLTNIRNGDAEWSNNMKFASVGISSPEGTTGLNYTYLNTYPVSAAPLQARRALLFTTSPKYKACTLFGTVLDFRTGWPIQGAQVYTEHGFAAVTDENGFWQINDALAEVPFDITAHMMGYNDSTYLDQEIVEGDTVEYNFDLLHPEFTPSTNMLMTFLDPDRARPLPLNIFNGGNGPLTWRAEKRLLGDANAAPWELRRTYLAGQICEDDRLEGVVFANDQFYIAGSNGADPSLIYILNREGELINTFEQFGTSRYGYKDLEWDGDLLWGSGADTVFGFTPDNQLVQVWRGPHNPNGSIAYDTDENILWISGITTNILAVDQAGNLLDRVLDRHNLRINGLSYWPEDPDNHKLYLTASLNTNPVTHAVYKMNTENGDTIRVFDLPLRGGATSLMGGWITNQFDVYSWVMMIMANAPPDTGSDRIEVYQVDARKDWMELSQWSGVLGPEETEELSLMFDAAGLPDTLFEGELVFHHDADSGRAVIGVRLQVIGPMPPADFTLLEPANGDTVRALPLFGDTLHLPSIQFNWQPSNDLNFDDTTLTYLFNLSNGNETVEIALHNYSLDVVIDTLGIPFWFDMPLTWWVKVVAGPDTVQCAEPFIFHIIPDAVDQKPGIPVEFGFQSLYPSPFNSSTTIKFGADRAVATSLKAYDLTGREVASLFEGVPKVGYHKIAWNADHLASSVYVLRLESAGRVQIRKIALIR